MPLPSKEHLIEAAKSKGSLTAGGFMVVFDFVWGWTTRLFEHIMLQWVADRLGESPLLKWSIEHPFQLFMALGLSYCLIIVFIALRKSKKQNAPIPLNATDPPRHRLERISQDTGGDRIASHNINAPQSEIHIHHVSHLGNPPPAAPLIVPPPALEEELPDTSCYVGWSQDSTLESLNIFVWNGTPYSSSCTISLVNLQRWSEGQQSFIDDSPYPMYPFKVAEDMIAPENQNRLCELVRRNGESLFTVVGLQRDRGRSGSKYGRWRCQLSITMGGKKRFQDICFTFTKSGLMPLTSLPEDVSRTARKPPSLVFDGYRAGKKRHLIHPYYIQHPTCIWVKNNQLSSGLPVHNVRARIDYLHDGRPMYSVERAVWWTDPFLEIQTHQLLQTTRVDLEANQSQPFAIFMQSDDTRFLEFPHSALDDAGSSRNLTLGRWTTRITVTADFCDALKGEVEFTAITKQGEERVSICSEPPLGATRLPIENPDW